MEHRRFGRTGADVPVIGQGTWKLHDPLAARAVLRRGLDEGMTHIDTAEMYTGSERTIAPLLKGRRDQVWLVSKVLPRNADRKGTIAHCRASLERLETDHIDVYLLHWKGQHPIHETMAAMAELVDEGLIHHAGVSNLDVAGMEEAQAALGGLPLACNQVLYNPERRDIEAEVVPWCRAHGVAVVGYSPFGSGDFPGGRAGQKRLADIGRPFGKTVHQVVLDCLTRDESVFVIPKTEDPEHASQNAHAVDERLPQEAYDAFDEAFPVPHHVEGVPSL